MEKPNDLLLIIILLLLSFEQVRAGAINCVKCSQWVTKSCGIPFSHDVDRQVIMTCHSGACKAVVYRTNVGRRDTRILRSCKEETDFAIWNGYLRAYRKFCYTELCNADDDFLTDDQSTDCFSSILLLFSCAVTFLTQ